MVIRRTAPGGLRGEHRANRRGRGIEFSDYRPYVPGDDMRDVDWKAFLRLDRTLLRLFEEEGDLPVYLLIDASRSMGEPDDAKLDQAKRLAAGLAYVSLAQEDRVWMVAFGEGVLSRLDAVHGADRLPRLLDFLRRLEPGGRTDLDSTVRGFFSTPRRRGLVVLLSDFLYGESEPREPSCFAWLAALRQEVLAVQLTAEQRAPTGPTARVETIDSETGEAVRIQNVHAAWREHEQLSLAHADRLRAACRRRGWTYLPASVDQPFDELLLRFFRSQGAGR